MKEMESKGFTSDPVSQGCLPNIHRKSSSLLKPFPSRMPFCFCKDAHEAFTGGRGKGTTVHGNQGHKASLESGIRE